MFAQNEGESRVQTSTLNREYGYGADLVEASERICHSCPLAWRAYIPNLSHGKHEKSTMQDSWNGFDSRSRGKTADERGSHIGDDGTKRNEIEKSCYKKNIVVISFRRISGDCRGSRGRQQKLLRLGRQASYLRPRGSLLLALGLNSFFAGRPAFHSFLEEPTLFTPPMGSC